MYPPRVALRLIFPLPLILCHLQTILVLSLFSFPPFVGEMVDPEPRWVERFHILRSLTRAPYSFCILTENHCSCPLLRSPPFFLALRASPILRCPSPLFLPPFLFRSGIFVSNRLSRRRSVGVSSEENAIVCSRPSPHPK